MLFVVHIFLHVLIHILLRINHTNTNTTFPINHSIFLAHVKYVLFGEGECRDVVWPKLESG